MPWRISNKENKQDELCNSSSLLPEENHQGAVQEGVTRQSLLLRSTASAAKSLQSCSTLCDPIDGNPPASAIPGIFQARTLEWIPISFSNAWKWKWSLPVVSDSSRPHGLQPTRLLRPWDFPGKGTGVGCHCLLCNKWQASKFLSHLLLLEISNYENHL